MALLDKHLGSNEQMIYRFRPSRKAFLLEYLAFIIVLLINLGVIYPLFFLELNRNIAIILKILGYVLGVITTVLLAKVEFKIWSRRYALTNQRIMYSKGIFSETFHSSVYTKVTDIGLRQSFIERILNTGTVHINTSGGDDIELRLDNVSRPFDIKKKISDLQAQAQTNTMTMHHSMRH